MNWKLPTVVRLLSPTAQELMSLAKCGVVETVEKVTFCPAATAGATASISAARLRRSPEPRRRVARRGGAGGLGRIGLRRTAITAGYADGESAGTRTVKQTDARAGAQGISPAGAGIAACA